MGKVSRKQQTLERQVERKIKDLTMRLETEKEEVASRLSKLSLKVSKMQRAASATKLKKKPSASKGTATKSGKTS